MVGQNGSHESLDITDSPGHSGGFEEGLPVVRVTDPALRLSETDKAVAVLLLVCCAGQDLQSLIEPTDRIGGSEGVEGALPGQPCIGDRLGWRVAGDTAS